MRVDAERFFYFLFDFVDDLLDFECECSAVGVAEAQDIRSALFRGFQGFQRVGLVRLISVEEMFGVEYDLFSCFFRNAMESSISSRFSSRLIFRASFTWRSQILPNMATAGFLMRSWP